MRGMVKNFLEVLDLTPGHMGGLHMSITDEIYYNTVPYNIGDNVLNPDGPGINPNSYTHSLCQQP